jgi:ABC-type transport system substrate-binding protein
VVSRHDQFLRKFPDLGRCRKPFIDILGEGQYDVGAVLQPPPEGIWGMPREMLEQLTGYGPDVRKNREEATQFYENYSCRSSCNYTGCNPEVDTLIERQSAETDPAKRKELVWQIERKLVQDAVRPIIFFMRQGTCW